MKRLVLASLFLAALAPVSSFAQEREDRTLLSWDQLRAILPRKLTVLQLRDFLTGEFEPVPLADMVAYSDAQASIGVVKLIEQAPEADGKRKEEARSWKHEVRSTK